MKKLKRMLVLLTTLILCSGCLSIPAFAALNTGHSVSVKYAILYIDSSYNAGYTYSTVEITTFVCQYKTPHSDSASTNHTIANSDIKNASIRHASKLQAGYSFVGWAKTASKNPTIYSFSTTGSTACNKGDTIYLVARRASVTYTLSYNANGGANPPAAQNVSSTTGKASFTISSTRPTRPGYTFKGWAASANAVSAQYQPGGTYTTSAANSTLYAVWEKNEVTYTLNYDANGGDGAPAAQNVSSANGSAGFTLPDTEPCREGYVFLGWADTPGADQAEYQPGDSYVTNKTTSTLYAVWKVTAEDDTLVLDYGLAVALNDIGKEWSILTNDNYSEVYRVANGEEQLTLEFVNADCKYGEIILDEDTGIYYYKPIQIMAGMETIDYSIRYEYETENGSGVVAGEATLTIIPSSIMHYEADFIAGRSSDTTINKDKIQTPDSEYGYDDVYAATSENGDTVDVAFSENSEELEKKFQFAFTGSGADIIGITNTQSGKLTYIVTDQSGTAVQYGVVDTYYSVKETDGIEQVPVINIRMEERGTYTVTVNVHKSGADANADSFTLQGIRIYSTLSNDDYYEFDGENALQETAEIFSVRELMKNTQAAILNVYEGESDGIEAFGGTITENIITEKVTLSDEVVNYLAKGPSNEAYIGEGVGYAFVATVTGEEYVLSVEARTIAVCDGGASEELNLSLVNDEVSYVNTVSPGKIAMYYAIDLSKCIQLAENKYLVILAGASNDNGAISLSNIKANNIEISCPYLDEDAMQKIYVDDEDPLNKVQIQEVRDENDAIKRGKTVTYSVHFNTEEIAAVKEDLVINVYCNGEIIGSADAEDISSRLSNEDTTVYLLSFKAPSSKGTYMLSFYTNDGNRDSINGVDFSMIVR